MFSVKGLNSLKDISSFLDGQMFVSDHEIAGINFDSRHIKKNELFIPLKGDNFDGNNYIDEVERKGGFALSDRKESKCSILVENVYESLLKLAKKNLEEIRPKIVFITGSHGKTTIKDMLKFSLGEKCHASKENQNNQFGIPFTILQMPHTSEIIIVECGARKEGDFDEIAKHLFCDVFVLTDIAHNHIETFKSIENIESTKLKLLKTLVKKENFIDGRKIEQQNYLQKNLLISKRVLEMLELEESGELYEFVPSKGRGNREKFKNAEIIDHSYNANPKAIIETAKLENPNKTVLILGDMAELGKDELKIHCDLLNKLEGYEIFITGKIFYECFRAQKRDKLYFFKNEKDFPKKILSTKLDEGINLYFKGSRSSKMERYIDIIKND
ncbi:UDP-N-acetylmuramoyl-tripeptide--D-alanyl-D-alanine ligase [bacterium]|nr:UDP-N-acetylmuramoyl-tripeptide--D-alanyl-D-alanine ligase [bacterium]